MNNNTSVENLLRWRLSQAEADAPPAPRAARLLELARPWWEVWPHQFQALAERVRQIQIAYGHAMAEPRQGRLGYPVPTVVVGAEGAWETTVRVLYLTVRDGRLRFRFQLAADAQPAPERFGTAFVSDHSAVPILCVPATRSVESEYRVDAELPAELARALEGVKVTDRMPFRLILRPDGGGG